MALAQKANIRALPGGACRGILDDGRRLLLLATNFRSLAQHEEADLEVVQVDIRADGSWIDALRIMQIARGVDAVILNIAAPTVLKLCLLRWILPWAKWKLISVDILLPRPVTTAQRVVAYIKRTLLRRVDRFVLYFHDLNDYQRFYGINPQRTSYTPFKANSWERLPPESELSSDGEYIITAGRTMRDLSTFVAAMRLIPYPAVLMYLRHENLGEHGTAIPSESLPPNVRLLEHDGNRASWIENMRRAKVVVIPILPSTISSSGIGTSIDAMAMKKCVVITEGKATRGILTNQAVVVPAKDPAALAAAVRRAWEDDAYRARIATNGRAYAEGLAGEARLHQDIVRITSDFLRT